MKVLVATGSKYGSTREIGRIIGDDIADAGFEVDVMDASDVHGVHFYDAAIVGGAVYGGLWRRDASALVDDFANDLAKFPVWLFSVGLGPVSQPDQQLHEAERLTSAVNAREHRVFAGSLSYDKLNMGEKALIRALNPPQGDFRDVAEIRAWVQDIILDLRTHALD